MSGERTRLRLVCRGTVQGVGFRPAVHRLAGSLGLGGKVANTPEGVVVEVEGPREQAKAFVDRLPGALPPLARLAALEVAEVEPVDEVVFTVAASEPGTRERALVPPDSALCPACRAEIEDPCDRRHRYPFTTCTDCGPRFSLVRELPYDRERTSMACFPLCADCRREYTDPGDRRFHAEPVACPACGPRLWLQDRGRVRLAEGPDALAAARAALEAGRIVAVKGLGGFQLACRADDADAVALLRERKRRPSKPFAVMVADLERARALVEIGEAEEELLASSRAPAVLAPRRHGCALPAALAPGLADLGVLLPTTPLHVELFRGAAFPALIMTSGNASDEPICRGNREAIERLAGIADLYLLHDRDVVRRVDDSVVRSHASGPIVVRRARGFVPDPLPLPLPVAAPVLALGSHLQATACLAVGSEAFCSQHVGDLDTEGAREFLAEAAAGLEEFLQARASVIAVDAHPDYGSTVLGERLAAERGARLARVQHHHAHAAAVLAEHGRFPAAGDTALAIALDGTGWGPDGTAWGGEWLEVDGEGGWRRLAHLDPLPLPGGEAAVREPWRVAVAALARGGERDLIAATPLAHCVTAQRLSAVARLADDGGLRASGAGRVFEAAGALLGLAVVNGYEGEAAARLEALAASEPAVGPWPEVALDDSLALPGGALLVAAARRIAGGEPRGRVARGFHASFAALVVDLTTRIGQSGACVAVAGGCLVNRLLRSDLEVGLQRAGFVPLFARQMPPGDGAISYGQAVVAAVATRRGEG